MDISPLGDAALLIELGGDIDHATLARVTAAIAAVERADIAGITDIVAGYTSLAVHYDPVVVLHGAAGSASVTMRAAVERALADAPQAAPASPSRTVDIPVRYGGPDGPDLADVAALHGLTAAEVVAMHTAVTYTVHMIGFLPGFPYLGGLDPRLATPRRATPRTLVPAGSVGIGGAQTGVYPVDSPGGWHLIGRTPLDLFDVQRAEPALLRLGDRVRFVDAGGA